MTNLTDLHKHGYAPFEAQTQNITLLDKSTLDIYEIENRERVSGRNTHIAVADRFTTKLVEDNDAEVLSHKIVAPWEVTQREPTIPIEREYGWQFKQTPVDIEPYLEGSVEL